MKELWQPGVIAIKSKSQMIKYIYEPCKLNLEVGTKIIALKLTSLQVSVNFIATCHLDKSAQGNLNTFLKSHILTVCYSKSTLIDFGK